MKRIVSIIILVMLILSTVITSAFAQETKTNDNELENTLDAIINLTVQSGKAKGSVLSIVENGDINLSKGYGFADEYNDYLADSENTAFRIGSVSKTFVAVAAEILNQEGKLDMNQDISIYLESDFPKLAYPVTMHQLLTHTAGFEDMITGIAVSNVSDTESLFISVRKYMPSQMFKPGEVVSYSNYGIALAAYVVERISNQDFSRFCEDEIFLPLEMNKTTFKHMHDIVYVSKPYLPNGDETIEPFMNLYPEGSAVSTADDMAKYMIWLLNSEDTRVLSQKFKNEILSKQFAMSDNLSGMGYTWTRKTRNDSIYYIKKGETLNFYSRIVLYPQKNTGIFLSFNTYVPEEEINTIIEKATDLLYGKKIKPELNSGNASINIKGLNFKHW